MAQAETQASKGQLTFHRKPYWALLLVDGCIVVKRLGRARGIGNTMAWGVKKTEHAGAKKGTGAFYGRKADAKRASSRRRRQTNKSTINIEIRDNRNEW